MANLRDIRDRISSVKSTQQITKAMKMVAAARLRKAQERIISTRPFVTGLERVIAKLAKSRDTSNKFMVSKQDPKKILVITISSDRGLCGGFNSNLFRFLSDSFSNNFPGSKESGNLSLVTVGRKSYDYFRKRGFNIIDYNNGFFDKLSFENSTSVLEFAADRFLSGEFDSVYIGYNEFKTVISQNRVLKKILPVEFDITNSESANLNETDYIYEPNPAAILEDIIPLHLNMQMWRAVLESNAAEQGARMAAMDNATENAKEIIRALNLQYNQARQAAITTELSEIVSGAEALKG